jgi:hypothetical protein
VLLVDGHRGPDRIGAGGVMSPVRRTGARGPRLDSSRRAATSG